MYSARLGDGYGGKRETAAAVARRRRSPREGCRDGVSGGGGWRARASRDFVIRVPVALKKSEKKHKSLKIPFGLGLTG